MRCNLKRWISLVLAFVMVLTMLPVTARAEECTHENWGHKSAGNSGYFVIDSDYHGITYYFSRVCVDCGAVIMERDPSQTYTQKNYHDIFYLDNFCLVCNYRPGSTHTHNYQPGTTTVTKNYMDATYHNVVTTTNMVCSCGSAGTPTVTTVQEAHTLDSSRTCTGCGYQAPCTHENSGYVMETQGYERVDGQFHVMHYRSYQKCQDCGKILENYGTSSTQERHQKVPESTDTSLVKLDDTYHVIVTTTYMRCPCGYSTNSTSRVQEAHTFGAAVEVSPGSWQKTCTGCGGTCQVAAPVQPTPPETTPPETTPPETTPPATQPEETMPTEPHVHEYAYVYKIEAEHPHNSAVYCACGEYTWEPQSLKGCCECSGQHIWGYPVRLPDGSFKQNCTKCDALQTVMPSEGVKTYYKIIDIIKYRRSKATKYQEDHGIDSAACAIWKTIAEQATDKLYTNDDDFVTTAETLETIRKGLLGIGWDALTYQSWDEQQTDCWKQLLMQMLEAENEADRLASEFDAGDSFVGFNANVMKVFENITGSEKDRLKELSDELEANIGVLGEKLDQFADADPTDSALASTMMDKLETMQEAMENRKAATDPSLEDKEYWNDLLTDFGWLAQWTGFVLDGGEHYFMAREYRNALTSLNESANNVVILEEIYHSAMATGNTNLANAASELKEEIEESMVEALNELVSLVEGLTIIFVEYFAWGFGLVAKESLEGAVKAVSESLSKVMDVLGLGALVMDIALGWGPVYDEAQTLMTLNYMDATANILEALKEKDDPYMAKLWGVLQTEGCRSAQEFLKKYNAANKLDLKDLGIDDGGLFGESELPDVMEEVAKEGNFYIAALELAVEKLD